MADNFRCSLRFKTKAMLSNSLTFQLRRASSLNDFKANMLATAFELV